MTDIKEDQETSIQFVRDLNPNFKSRVEENKDGETVEAFAARFQINPAAVNQTNVENVKHLKTIQMTREEFNAEQDRQCEEQGIDYRQLRWSREHHPLKTRRDYEFKLTDLELETLLREGTVISGKSFGDFGNAYRRLYSNDIPVYVSADSILQAWHITFDFMLEELETSVLQPALAKVLSDMLLVLGSMDSSAAQTQLSVTARADIAHYLAVPLALMNGLENASTLNIDAPTKARVDATLANVHAAQPNPSFLVFGGKGREIDFSQFTPRGHYTKTPALSNYFRGMMWMGRTEFELDRLHPNDIAAALLLEEVYGNTAGAVEVVGQVMALMTNFIGVPDSMTFRELSGVLKECGISYAEYDHDRDGSQFLGLLNEMDAGSQQINSQLRDVSDGEIPRAVTFLGQRFTLDAWAMCKTVYPDVPEQQGVRRIPSGIDVAYSVFGNDTAGSIAASRMMGQNPTTIPFRDNVPYVSQLTSLRSLMDEVPEAFWRSSIYGMWIRTLKSLSNDAIGKKHGGQEMAWKLKSLNTQLGSWAQLRHDTILYVKQGYTSFTCCEFPDALIEPVPLFWESMVNMANQTRALIEQVGYPDAPLQAIAVDESEQSRRSGRRMRMSQPETPASGPQLQERHVQFFGKMAGTLERLKMMCEKQCAGEELNAEDLTWLNTMCVLHSSGGSGAHRYWRGWYPDLFYNSPDNVEQEPMLVADVHTDPPSDHGNRGDIVHEGVGFVRLCYTLAGDGVFVGPVFTYYEHLVRYPNRLDDDAWKKELVRGEVESPHWIAHLMSPPSGKVHASGGRRR